MRKIILGLGIAALVATAAGCSSSGPDPATTSGTLHIFGSTANVNANSLPVTLRGVISTTGSLPVGGNSTKATITTKDGDLNVSHTNPPTGQPSVNGADCTASDVTAGTFTVLGGTGKFAGATGHGSYTITFNGKFAKTNGQCKITQNSTPTSGTLTFRATGPLTIKG
jgi:hypothetical protein